MKDYIHIIFWLLFIAFWQISGNLELLPKYIIPTPFEIIKAIFTNFELLLNHSKTTLLETFLGLFIGTFLAIILSIFMSLNKTFMKIIYPFFIVLQSIPTIAIAPILILWLGFDLLPKVTLIIITTTFPILISVLDGLNSAKKDYINLLISMNANRLQILKFYIIPNALPYFFAGFKVSTTYAYISAVVAEWLGGFTGLGVYMLQTKKLFEYDLMFGIIFIISLLSLVSVKLIKFIENKVCKGV